MIAVLIVAAVLAVGIAALAQIAHRITSVARAIDAQTKVLASDPDDGSEPPTLRAVPTVCGCSRCAAAAVGRAMAEHSPALLYAVLPADGITRGMGSAGLGAVRWGSC